MGVPTWSWCRSAPQSCWRLAQGLPRARPAHGHARAFTSFKGVFALANYPKGLIKRQQLLFSALFAGCTGGRSLGGALRSSQSPCLQDAALWMHLSPISHLMPPALSPGSTVVTGDLARGNCCEISCGWKDMCVVNDFMDSWGG